MYEDDNGPSLVKATKLVVSPWIYREPIQPDGILARDVGFSPKGDAVYCLLGRAQVAIWRFSTGVGVSLVSDPFSLL